MVSALLLTYSGLINTLSLKISPIKRWLSCTCNCWLPNLFGQVSIRPNWFGHKDVLFRCCGGVGILVYLGQETATREYKWIVSDGCAPWSSLHSSDYGWGRNNRWLLGPRPRIQGLMNGTDTEKPTSWLTRLSQDVCILTLEDGDGTVHGSTSGSDPYPEESGYMLVFLRNLLFYIKMDDGSEYCSRA